MMGVLLLVLAIAMGIATFIENDFSTEDARNLIYNHWWFELVLFLICINFLGNIVRYKLWSRDKWAVLMFHIGFVVTILGAGITRFTGVEGLMPIREGETTSEFISENRYFSVIVDDNKYQKSYEIPTSVSELYDDHLDIQSSFRGNTFSISSSEYIYKSEPVLIDDPEGKTYITIVSTSGQGRETHYLAKGELKSIDGLLYGYDIEGVPSAIHFMQDSITKEWKIFAPFSMTAMRMADQQLTHTEANTTSDLKLRHLYTIVNKRFVIPEIKERARLIYKDKANPTEADVSAIKVTAVVNGQKKETYVLGRKNSVGAPVQMTLNGLNFRLSYGSKKLNTPFKIKLDDFIVTRYPGSESPSSFESKVQLIDQQEQFATDYRIYMNHVLDYRGYRFFQASYDPDELGTILSVNQDYWGTMVTYVGYTLMFVGMALSLLIGKTRFIKLQGMIKKLGVKAGIIVLLTMSTQTIYAQNHTKDTVPTRPAQMSLKTIDSILQTTMVSPEHADHFATITVQDMQGRMKPIHTLASELVRKVHHKDQYKGYTPSQLFLSWLKEPFAWYQIPFIYIKKGTGVHEKLNIKTKYASFLSFFDGNAVYKLGTDLKKAYAKKAADRSVYEQEIIKVDERLNIMSMMFEGMFLRIFPLKGDVENTWYTSTEHEYFRGIDTVFVKSMVPYYLYDLTVDNIAKNNYVSADEKIEIIKKYQRDNGADVVLSETKTAWEMAYNKQQPFEKLYKLYLLVSVFVLFMAFAMVFQNKTKASRWSILVVGILSVIMVVYHGVGLAVRWYISGHAPWSDGYESMVFISFCISSIGLAFVTKSWFTLGSTQFLTALLMFVAHLSFFDPTVTNLVPVLDSYWLMIHVSIITSSYGPLMLGGVLGVLVMILYILSNDKNKDQVKRLTAELTYINERILIVGVYLLSIGTFLGGIWANESWGRYWAWDPKETWALISILIYAFVLHMRLIPGMRGNYLFNVMAIFAVFSILMTYFGVNFYLSGLHSYAKGDPVPIPTYLYYLVGGLIGLTVLAQRRKKRFELN